MAQQYRNYGSQQSNESQRNRSTRVGPGGYGAVQGTQWDDETSPQSDWSDERSFGDSTSGSPYDARDYGRSETGYGRPSRGQFRGGSDPHRGSGQYGSPNEYGRFGEQQQPRGQYGSGSDYYSEPSSQQWGGSSSQPSRRYGGGGARDLGRHSGQGFSQGNDYGAGGYSSDETSGYGQDTRYGQRYGQGGGQSQGDGQQGYGQGYGQNFGSGSGSSYGSSYGSSSGSTSYRGKGPKGYQRSDDRLKEMICERLTDDHHIDASSFSVNVKNGEVTLEGTVRDRQTKHRAEDLVESCGGVKEIHNNLKVERSSGSGEGLRSEELSSRGASSDMSSTGSSRSTTRGTGSQQTQ